MKVKYHEKPPRFYGFAYEILEQRVAVYYLFPFNHVVGIGYLIWHKIRHAKYVRNYIDNFEKNKETTNA